MWCCSDQITWIERQTYQPRELRFISSMNEQAFDYRETTPLGDKEELKTNGMEFNDPLYPLQWYLVLRKDKRII